MSKATARRFREVADQLFEGTISDLARALDMKPTSFSKYTNAPHTTPGSSLLERLSDLGVSADWMLSGRGAMLLRHGKPAPVVAEAGSFAETDMTAVPFYSVEVSAGNGRITYEEEKIDSVLLPTSEARRMYGVDPGRLFDIRVSGDSMTPTIQPGEEVRCLKLDGEALVDGRIYLIRGPWGLMVKRVVFAGDEIVLVSDNDSRRDTALSQSQFEEEYEAVAALLDVRNWL